MTVTQRITLAMLLGGMSPLAVQADVYKFVDKHGRVYLTDNPDHGGYKLLFRTRKGWSPSPALTSKWNGKRNKAYDTAIAKAALVYRLPNALLHAVIKAESAYNPNAVSRAGAVGLMQLMPDTATRYGVPNRLDPIANLHGGSRYLRDLLAMFKNNLVLALAAYNAGENAVIRYGNKVPPYSETQTYVKRVVEFYKQIQLAKATEISRGTPASGRPAS
ncbi:MAG: transglycosylase SLT domain-containing protein [Gammaproteobacteria bacterium]